VVVIDNETYESAKKKQNSRKTLRTGLENEQKRGETKLKTL
jgi:hypothetical protein